MTLSNDNYNEAVNTVSSASGTVTVDLEAANLHIIDTVDNITIDVTNFSSDPAGNSLLLHIADDDGAGPYTISWPSGTEWPGGNISDTVEQNGNIEIGIYSPDGGTTLRAAARGSNFQ